MPRLVDGLEQVFTDLGIIGAGYKLFFFETTTTTPKTTYSDVGLTVANPNPVVCDASGRPEFDIWGDDPSTYKMVLGTPDSTIGSINPIVTVDPVNDLNAGSIIVIDPLPTAYWGLTTGTSTDYILDPALVPIISYNNKQCFLVDFHIACGPNPTLNINNLGNINLKKYANNGTKIFLENNDLQVQRYIAINDGTDIVILNPGIEQNFKANNLTINKTINGAVFAKNKPTLANDGITPNNKIDFSAGAAFSKENNIGWASPAISKDINSNWAVGAGNGGLDTGTKANNTYYYCYSIYNPTTNTADAIFTATFNSPTLPSGYTSFSYCGAIRIDGSGNILSFTQENFNRFMFKAPFVSRAYAPMPTVATNLTFAIPSNFITINDVRVDSSGGGTAATGFGLFCPNNAASLVASSTNYNFQLTQPGGTSQMFCRGMEVKLDNSSQANISASAAIGLEILTWGFIDPYL